MKTLSNFANRMGFKTFAKLLENISEIFADEQVRLSRLPPQRIIEEPQAQKEAGLYDLLEGSIDPKPTDKSEKNDTVQLAGTFGLHINTSPFGGYVLNTMSYFDECWGKHQQHSLGAYTRIELCQTESSLEEPLRTIVLTAFLTDSRTSKKEYFQVTETYHEHQVMFTISWKCFPEMPWCEIRKLKKNPIKTNVEQQATVFNPMPQVSSKIPEANPDLVFQSFQQSMLQQRRA